MQEKARDSGSEKAAKPGRRPATPSQRAEDLDTARLVTRVQAGDREAFAALYTRYFDRVYAYMRVALKDHHEAEDAAQQVFVQVLEAIPRYEQRKQPFRAWLFAAARNYALAHLRKHGRIEVEDPDEIDRRRDASGQEPDALDALSWITDADLLTFVERLTLPQRQVLVLRYLLGFTSAETAKLLGRTPASVRMLQSRAEHFIKDRLVSLGRAPTSRRREPSRGWQRQAPVVRTRRFSLSDSGPSR